MNMENNPTHFNHEEWLNSFFRFAETARQFFQEALKGLKALSQKGFIGAWREIRAAATRLTPQDFLISGLITFTGFVGGLIFTLGLGLFSYQAILWLQDGVWTEFPLFAVFNFLFANTALHQWLIQPESWMGLQKLVTWVLQSTPLSLALIVPGFSIALTMAGTFALALLLRFNQLKNRND
ncbi:MAG: hypothetical protein HOL15_10060 [Nitrospinaceae bacterium]|jgi:hypothetical protein|nr:hypothetical protein [Nitrospina sp.]MBT5377145.1 hypothetical protein [Nitrospinaceae bacterium]MBT5868540.1 hypothetical protein [Nitrospinaceae bacterium]MBT6346844.1 hypothetical protein [Nitrospina sp.]